uniref:non-specific serine/threonine protein kinase n=1 Tax=Chlorobium chlorochromatii (strain CaD3) TaxID=340177 RepID=Q3AT94_CHLCH
MKDLDLIKLIEDKVNIKLALFENLSSINTGYKLNAQGDVSELSLSKCKISSLYLFIDILSQFKHLQILYLNDNNLSDVALLSKLTQLKALVLLNNPINSIPFILTNLPLEFEWKNTDYGHIGFITLYNNPLTDPPPEIVAQGKEAVRSYLLTRQKAEAEGQQMQVLHEVKVHLVGDGMAGKTSLLKQLQGLAFDKNESQTHGINVVSLQAPQLKGCKINNELKESIFHFWDFGGQEIMHASHQFFMSSRSIYILLLDSRTDSNKYYWLRHIEKYGAKSPIIVVMNKIDENPSYNIQQQSINQQFPAINNRFHRVSCNSGEGLDGVVLSLIAVLNDEGCLYGAEFPPAWLAVKKALVTATAQERHISRNRYEELCSEQGINDAHERDTLLGYLDNLGIVFYFKESHFTNNIYVLDPHWVTVGVYRIVNSAKTANGIFKLADLEYILNQEEISSSSYTPAQKKHFIYKGDEQRYLVDIMKQFELCYEEENGRFILPSNLSKEPQTALPNLEDETPLRFIMQYDYLPAPIIPRLMIAMKDDVVEELRWRYGMVLQSKNLEGVQASVIANQEKKEITIIVKGPDRYRRSYFTIIWNHLRTINQRFENLQVKEFIPLPGYPNEFVEYEELLGHARNGRDNYFSGKLGQAFSVSTILNSIISTEERYRKSENMEVQITFSPIIKVEPPVHTQNVTVQLELHQHIEELQGRFRILKEDLLDEVEIELEDPKEQKRLFNELNKVENAITEMAEAANSEQPKRLSSAVRERLDGFLESLHNPDSRLNKVLQAVEKGAERVKTLSDIYQKCKPFFEQFPIS